MKENKTYEELLLENKELRARLREAEEILSAIRSGEVDALVVSTPKKGDQVFTLKGAEQPYRILIEVMKEGAVTLAQDDTILYCNMGFARMLKSPLEKMIGTGILHFVSPEDKLAFKKLVRQGKAGGSKGEVTFLAGNGTAVPAHISIDAMKLNGFSSVYLVAMDITERKLAEEALRKAYDELEVKVQERTAELAKANEKLRLSNEELEAMIDELDEKTEVLHSLNMYNKAIIQSMNQGMIVLNNSDIITTWNPAAEEILGINEEDTVGRNIFSIISGLGINIDEIKQKIRRIDKRRMIPHVIMQEYAVRSGENKFMKLTVIPLTDIAGKSQGKMILLQLMDITTLRKKAEKELKNQTADLQKLSTVDLQGLVHELQVHQIELEMQNEELRRAQIELEESRSRDSDQYDFAPIGYFTFDKNGHIIEVNLTGANKLGVERSILINKPFSLYIDFSSRDVFYLHLRKVFETGTKKTCGIRLVSKDGNQFDALMESQAVQDKEGNTSQCRSVVIDLTELKVKADIG